MSETLHVLNYGGGRQTIALCLLVAHGALPRPGRIVIADTSREAQSTWDYLDTYVAPCLAAQGLTVERASHNLATVDLYGLNGDLLIPAFTATGKLPTFCSQEWKARVVQRYLRQSGVGADVTVTSWIGFAAEEQDRIRGNYGTGVWLKRYPLVELALAGLWAGAWMFLQKGVVPVNVPFVIAVAIFFFVLLVTTMIDFDWKIIPDEASYLLLATGLITSYWNPFLGAPDGYGPVLNSLIGVVAGGVPLWIIAIAGKFLLKKEAMGGGDIKLLAGIGAFLGWQAAIGILVLASLLGCAVSIVGLILKVFKRGQYIAFGPFLNVAAAIFFILKCVRIPVLSTVIENLLLP
jgi:prepilin signal peptidase PulO-like enzyme (type II secretory pathway)